jgi:predicted MPP superfamily phosphohydrolase
MGVYAVLGNHDYSVRNALGVRRYPKLPDVIREALERVGVQVIENTHRVLQRNGESLAVCGVADLWSRECRLAETLDAVPAELPRIVLAHNPASVEQLEGRRCDLMLSGHTHGGQILVPKLGPAMLSAKMRDYAAGLYRIPTGYLYVTEVRAAISRAPRI